MRLIKDFFMDTKLFSSCVNKYKFHHTKALEEYEIACKQLEIIILELLKGRNIPDEKITPFEIKDGKFVYVYTSGGHLHFRYPSDSFKEGYYDSVLLDASMNLDLILLIELLSGKRFEDLFK